MTTLPPHPDSRDSSPSDTEPFEFDESSLDTGEGNFCLETAMSDADEPNDDHIYDQDEEAYDEEAYDEDDPDGRHPINVRGTSDDQEFDDGEVDQHANDDSGSSTPATGPGTKRRGGLRLFCFNCNRPEGFFTANKGRWFYSYLTGMTFGMNHFVGPFRCRCCGHQRYLRANWMHPKTWFNNR